MKSAIVGTTSWACATALVKTPKQAAIQLASLLPVTNAMNPTHTFRLLTLVAALWHGCAAIAHEFWIDPYSNILDRGDPLVANLRNGQLFEGIALAWFETRIERFDLVSGESISPVQGRMGDVPALQSQADADGLLIILHETKPATLTYTEWEKFLAFAAHKDFPDAASYHEASGWPTDRFREDYTRHAKALLAVGSGSGADRAFGLKTEFIALSNPYEASFNGQMQVALEFEGTPRSNAQVEVFERAPDGSVTVSLSRTDAMGQVTVPTQPGHSYLFDAVVLRPAPEAGTTESAPVWLSHWAALTFAVP